MGNGSSFESATHERELNERSAGKSLEIFQRGLQLDALLRISKEIQEGKVFPPNDNKRRSPGEIIRDALVMPRTVTSKWSYSEQLYDNENTRHLVGPCTTFLSHPWSANFEDTVNAIAEHEKGLPADAPQQFYFVDYFAINQHQPKTDLKELGNLVKKCKSLVLMAKPWEKPVALTRLWCIYELAHALLGNTKLTIILPPEGKARFQQHMTEKLNNVWDFLGPLFENVDCEKATATMEKDIIEIKAFMKQELGGFNKVNEVVANGLRKWYQGVVLALPDEFPEEKQGTSEHAKLLYDVDHFLSSQGMYRDAERFNIKAAAIYKTLKKTGSWLNCQYSRVLLLSDMGRLNEALELAFKSVDDCIQEYRPDHARTLQSQMVLGELYRMTGKLLEAEELLRKVLTGFKKIQSPMSVEIRVTMILLGETLRDAGKLEEAKRIFMDVVKVETEAFGRSDEFTMLHVSHYARCIALQGNHQKAIELYKEALTVIRIKLGPQNREVQKCETWLKESRAQVEEIKTVE